MVEMLETIRASITEIVSPPVNPANNPAMDPLRAPASGRLLMASKAATAPPMIGQPQQVQQPQQSPTMGIN